MDDNKRQKINKFLQDEHLCHIVYEQIINSFLKDNKPVRDIQILAAERLAVELFKIAWRDLQSLKDKSIDRDNTLKQIGL